MNIPASEARDKLSDIINHAAFGKKRVVLTRRGKALVAVVPIEDMETLEAIEDQIDLKDALRTLCEENEADAITLEAFAKELGLEHVLRS